MWSVPARTDHGKNVAATIGHVNSAHAVIESTRTAANIIADAVRGAANGINKATNRQTVAKPTERKVAAAKRTVGTAVAAAKVTGKEVAEVGAAAEAEAAGADEIATPSRTASSVPNRIARKVNAVSAIAAIARAEITISTSAHKNARQNGASLNPRFSRWMRLTSASRK